MSSPETALVSIDRIATMLAEVSTVQEAIEMRDRCAALHSYAKSARSSLELQNEIATIKLNAERKAGRLLADLIHPDDGDSPKPTKSQSGTVTHSTPPPTLAELGLNKNQSSRWQRLASIPDTEFARYVQQQNDNGREITQNGLLKIALNGSRVAGTFDPDRSKPGLACPHCGYRYNLCDHNHGTPANATRRVRRCLNSNCNERYATLEVVYDPRNPIKAERVRFDTPPTTEYYDHPARTN